MVYDDDTLHQTTTDSAVKSMRLLVHIIIVLERCIIVVLDMVYTIVYYSHILCTIHSMYVCNCTSYIRHNIIIYDLYVPATEVYSYTTESRPTTVFSACLTTSINLGFRSSQQLRPRIRLLAMYVATLL